LGQRDYSMRACLDPDKMASLNLSVLDVMNAISQQNIQVAAGQIGQQPAPPGAQFQLTINTLGRLTDPEQFADIILKVGQGGPAGTQSAQSASQSSGQTGSSSTDQSGMPAAGQTSGTAASVVGQAASIVRLRDVARVELGAQQYEQSATLDGKPSVA